jgi:hypothetical protein
MKKKKAIKKHGVYANLQMFEMPKAGSAMEFEIFASNKKLGTIEIGRGSFTWYGKNRRKWKSFSWTDFAKEMDKLCYGE